MKKYYNTHDGTWKKIQEFLPKDYQWNEELPFLEEFKLWRNSTLHLERFNNPKASHKIILLHGVGTNSRLLNLIAGAKLAEAGYEVLAIDMPYYGMTDNQESYIRYQDWVEIGCELIRSEKAADNRPIVLYGLSAGGMLAYHIAAETRMVTGIMGMCFIDPQSSVARRRMSTRPNMDEIAFKLLSILPRFLLRNIKIPVKHLLNMDALVNDSNALKLLKKDRCSGGSSVTLDFIHSMMEYSPAIQFEKFDLCPIVLLQPGSDHWTPFSVTEPFWDRVGTQKHRVVLENGSHYPIEQPALTQMRDAMVDFIRGLH